MFWQHVYQNRHKEQKKIDGSGNGTKKSKKKRKHKSTIRRTTERCVPDSSQADGKIKGKKNAI